MLCGLSPGYVIGGGECSVGSHLGRLLGGGGALGPHLGSLLGGGALGPHLGRLLGGGGVLCGLTWVGYCSVAAWAGAS